MKIQLTLPAASSAFIPIRDPHTQKLVARINPATCEIEVLDSKRERHIVDLKAYGVTPAQPSTAQEDAAGGVFLG